MFLSLVLTHFCLYYVCIAPCLSHQSSSMQFWTLRLGLLNLRIDIKIFFAQNIMFIEVQQMKMRPPVFAQGNCYFKGSDGVSSWGPTLLTLNYFPNFRFSNFLHQTANREKFRQQKFRKQKNFLRALLDFVWQCRLKVLSFSCFVFKQKWKMHSAW